MSWVLGSPRYSSQGRVEFRGMSERAAESGWWYLSFAGDEGFRGGAVVEASDAPGALAEAGARKINPGGEVLILPIPADELRSFPLPLRNRLLTREQVEHGLNGGALADIGETPETVADYWGGAVVAVDVTGAVDQEGA